MEAAAFGSGVLAGFVLGLIGGGGSVLAVPLLVYAVGVPDPHVAIGTSAAAVAVSALANLVQHARAHNVKWQCASVFAFLGVVGAFVGSTLGKAFGGQKLLLLFGLVMILIAALMAKKRETAGDPERRADTGIGEPAFAPAGDLWFERRCSVRFFRDRRGLSCRTGIDGRDRYADAAGDWFLACFGHRLRVYDRRELRLLRIIDWRLAAFFISGGIFGGLFGGASRGGSRPVRNPCSSSLLLSSPRLGFMSRFAAPSSSGADNPRSFFAPNFERYFLRSRFNDLP